MLQFGYREAEEFACQGLIENWVHDFLTTKGVNHALSLGLKKQKRFWLGPVKVRLASLQRCCGPEKNMEFVQNQEQWDKTVAAMQDEIAKGWDVPPLIVNYTSGIFSIRDGNHRFEALRKIGFVSFWAIIWCDTQEEFNRVSHMTLD